MTGSSVQIRLVALEPAGVALRPGRWKVETVAVPLGVIGNTPDSGSGESWFEPRRGNREGWPSGLRRRPAKALGYGPRGFESHSLRFVVRIPLPPVGRGTVGPLPDSGADLVGIEPGSVLHGPATPDSAGTSGRVAERLKAHDWKSCGAKHPRGFESHPVRFWCAHPGWVWLGSRGVAQSGRALRSGRRGPRFESGRPDGWFDETGRPARPGLIRGLEA